MDGKNMEEFFSSSSNQHNNWAVLVCTSRFWFNYRHIANTLSVYHSIKRLGIPDSNILLMLADDVACNPRNPFPATVFNSASHHINVYDSDIEIDYRGCDVTVESFTRLLTGRHEPGFPRSKTLATDEKSHLLIYMSGHGGDGFLKFQDAEEVTSHDLADAIEQMHQKRRYAEILLMVDSCQAASMYEHVRSPNFLGFSSSIVGESSYSHHMDSRIGVAIIDRFTYTLLDLLEGQSLLSNLTFLDLQNELIKADIGSTVHVRKDLYSRQLKDVKLSDFFGNVQRVELTKNTQVKPYELISDKQNESFYSFSKVIHKPSYTSFSASEKYFILKDGEKVSMKIPLKFTVALLLTILFCILITSKKRKAQ